VLSRQSPTLNHVPADSSPQHTPHVHVEAPSFSSLRRLRTRFSTYPLQKISRRPGGG
jgi:hypothetical protein